MPKGKKWSLTDARKKKIIGLLRKQYTLEAIAESESITAHTLGGKLADAGLNIREIQNDGRKMLRTHLFNSIFNISKDSEKVRVGLEYLTKYPIADEETIDNSDNREIDIKIEILKELE